MADLPEQEAWEGVRQLETSDRALGGPGGVMNVPLRNLTNRTAYLKKVLEGKTGAASLTTAGIVKLSSATNSESSTDAATASAVKKAYDLAESKLSSIPFATASEVLDGEVQRKLLTPKLYKAKVIFIVM
ncbi:tail fiber protein [Budviciaceae bacterium BWR-B9]|uniref:Tail fiber protein n=1 Tax=Limnobaculum allomyrinae TaxID=2791986 RepID=A0ABS1IML1_9GAMM|nr:MULTISPECIES: phage tail protein [Limnobaculum]MBK5142978.1 tail fiber protein [Limnobaculum allomyrinae]MBV7693307.1 phage tail protein [Limnobaculum sp. M2-1]